LILFDNSTTSGLIKTKQAGRYEIVDVETIVRELKVLPPEKQRQVYDFICFLIHRSKSVKSCAKAAGKKLTDEPFIGIWKDREDMKDSTAWVRRIRNVSEYPSNLKNKLGR
jgi:hypothetical protein